MIYYIILIIIYFLIGFFEANQPIPENRRRIRAFVLLLPMWALVAFRAESIGCDTPHYALGYLEAQYYSDISDQLNYSRMEPGYVLIRYLFIKYGLSFFIFQIFTATVIYYSLYRFIAKYSSNVGMSCLLLMLTTRMFSTMNQTRMWLALSILLFSIQFLLERKIIKFLITVVVAYLFHKSALIFILMYPLCTLKYRRGLSIMLIIGSILISYLGIRFMGWFTDAIGVYGGYLDNIQFSEDRSTLAATVILIETIAFFLLFHYSGIYKVEQYNTILSNNRNCVQWGHYMKMSFFMVCGFAIIGLSNNIMSRVSSYFSIILLSMLPASLQRITAKYRLLLYIIVCLSLALEFGIRMKYRPYWYDVLPYLWGW